MSSRAAASLPAIFSRTTPASGSSSSSEISGSKKPSTISRVAARRPRLVQVDREHVEMLVLLREEHAAEGHVAARLRDRELEVLVHEMPAEQRGQPVAVCVAADLDDARRGVVHLARAEVLK